jgi:hypothetical protein
MKTFKVNHWFRFYYLIGFLILAFLILFSLFMLFPNCLYETSNFEKPSNLFEISWCFSFTLFGFCFVIAKILINDIYNINNVTDKDDVTEKRKILWRYSLFYPIMIFLIAYLSFIITKYQFKLTGNEFYSVSAIMSLFFGYFIDNSKNILDKIKSNK